RLGDARFARDQLQIAARARGRGRTDRRAAAWLATAQLRASEGQRGGAKRAAAAGLRILADHQQTLGATELRVGAAAHAERLARLGLQLALEDRRPRDVFRWAERVRANALATPTVRPPDDSPLAAALVELRRHRSDFDESRRAGTLDGELEAEVRRRELVVRDLARLVGNSPSRSGRPAEVRDNLQVRLGADRRLVEFVETDGAIHAVVVSERRYRLHTGLAAASEVLALVDQVGFGLGRLARRSVSAASQAASLASLTDALAQLDDALMRPLHLDDAELVIVPTGVLHNLPWGGIPSLAERPHSIAASATRWNPPVVVPAPPRVVVVAGPRLEDAPGEVDAVRSTFARARTLVGPAATVAGALDLLATADIAHVACHGHFRSDSPMFSSLELVDGPLTVYDLESVGAPPHLVVLPACNAGVAAVSVGDELIGTASALLGIGVGHVVAPVTIVNDAATVDVMRVFHRHLGDGAEPARALASTRAEIRASGNAAAEAAAMSLLCLE
ncbi:MAG: CHAT domain-containing protein, partial [Ilumatobacteraceae bacterium]